MTSVRLDEFRCIFASDALHIKIFRPVPAFLDTPQATKKIHYTKIIDNSEVHEYIAHIHFPMDKETNKRKNYCYLITHTTTHHDTLLGTIVQWTNKSSGIMELAFEKPKKTATITK